MTVKSYLYLAVILVSCTPETSKVSNPNEVKLGSQTVKLEDIYASGFEGSTIKKLPGIKNYLFKGKGLVTIKDSLKYQAHQIHLTRGKIITRGADLKIVTDSVTNKIMVVRGNIQIQYKGNRADVSNGNTAIITENEILIKSSIQ